jgi:hypothetical protein
MMMIPGGFIVTFRRLVYNNECGQRWKEVRPSLTIERILDKSFDDPGTRLQR